MIRSGQARRRRIGLDTVPGLVRDKKYIVLHTPRQTGKTSALLALRDLLNGGGRDDVWRSRICESDSKANSERDRVPRA